MECVRESIPVALKELEPDLGGKAQRPDFWEFSGNGMWRTSWITKLQKGELKNKSSKRERISSG